VQSTGAGEGSLLVLYNFLDLRNLNLHNTTLSTHHIPPPHLQVHERGKYMAYTKAVAASYSIEKARVLSYDFLQHVSTSAPPPPPPKAGSVKSLSVPPSVTPLLIPGHALAQGPNRDTDGAPGGEIADSVRSAMAMTYQNKANLSLKLEMTSSKLARLQ
jgi:hypothetical protein